MNTSILSLEDPAYINKVKAKWRVPPKRMKVIEFHGDGDPFFGGCADDRQLGREGNILPRLCKDDEVAWFDTIEEAHEAAKFIKNRRPGSLLGVAPFWR